MDLNAMLKEKITFRYHEALELLIAMGMLACEDTMRKVAEDYKLQLDSLQIEFFAFARERLSPHTQRELSFFFGHDFFHKSLDLCGYEFLARKPEIESALDLLEALAEEEAERLVSAMVMGVYSDRLSELVEGADWTAKSGDLAYLTVRVSRLAPEEVVASAREPLLECLAHPREAKQRLLLLLEQFYWEAFHPWKDRFRTWSEVGVERFRKQFEDNPAKFIRGYQKMSPDFYAQEPATAVHVSFCEQIGNHFLSFGCETAWLLFGLRNEEVYGTKASMEKAELFFKALSDKRRLEFVSLLLQRPHYGMEIAEILGITSAAVSYHANFLFFLDLIEVQRADHRLYYHLRKDKMRELLQTAERVLLDE
ncbi:ArsR/SmtB family transcription factor [Gorillibacterium sp. sgz500922]|uniref:ArsR/SmtB family transcription factor n=1 Tax=Gorillibacterium sp. sgz500922 TaxID=3446694 RepID=UPI003F66325F